MENTSDYTEQLDPDTIVETKKKKHIPTMSELKQKILQIKPNLVVMRLLSAWCITALLFFIAGGAVYTDLEKVGGYTLLTLVELFALSFVGVCFAAYIVKKLSRRSVPADAKILPFAFTAYAMPVLFSSGEIKSKWYVAVCFSAVAAILFFYYERSGWLHLHKALSKKETVVYIGIAAGIFLLCCAVQGIYRYKTYSCPNYDFGIFCNMFYNMKEHLTLDTTCERDKLLSHFAVHISPIYYLLLPVYWLFPKPETLQFMQAFILTSAVVPACLLAKKYNLSSPRIICVAIVALFHPVVICGTNYDFHENCFLLPLLLWMFWFFETEKYIPLAILTVGVLAVKEDAALYVLIFALFVFINRKKYLCGTALFVGAFAWFCVALAILSKYGEGVMFNRYDNYIVGDGTLLDVIRSVLENPAYMFTQIFEAEEADGKILFLLQLFVPLAFLPFNLKKFSQLLLICPMLIMNLVTVYPYQYQIGFQYCFGGYAFLLYLMIMNVSELKPETSRILLSTAAAASVFMFSVSGAANAVNYFMRYTEDPDYYQKIDAVWERVEEDDSVLCSTFFLPHLSDRDVIYEVHYHEPVEGEIFDWIFLDCRYDYEEYLETYTALGYEQVEMIQAINGYDTVLVMQYAGE